MAKYYIDQKALFQALTDKFKARLESSHVPTWNDAFDTVKSIPSADVVERKKSKWEWSSAYGYYFCPECHSISPMEDQDGNCIDCPNFCHDCGADMRNSLGEEMRGAS